MKKYKFILVLIVFFCSINVYAKDGRVRTRDNLLIPKDVIVNNNNIEDILKTPSVDENDKLYDFSNVLSRDEENKIYNDIMNYIKITKLDCVVVITSDLCGFDINKYAYNFYDYNNFNDMGIIFVIYINGDKKNIFMGNNGGKDSVVFSTYTDQRIKSILKYVYKNIKEDNYYQAISDYILLVERFFEKDNNVVTDSSEKGNVKGEKIPYVEIIILALSLSFIIILLLYRSFDKGNSNYHLNKIDTTTLNIVLESDNVLK